LDASGAARVSFCVGREAMKTITRRRVGWVLLGAGVVAGVALLASGRSFVSGGEVQRHSYPDGSFSESAILEFHWAYVASFAAGVTGLVLLLISRREKSSG